jgi:large subunit ribosomal protein L46
MPPVTYSPADYITQAGVVLSRPPLLTAAQSPFEKAFFFYQKRLNERLAMPFTRYFYFKKDTPADTDYKIKARERNGTAARELGGYRAYGDEAWNDELLSSDALAGQQGVGKDLGKMGIAEPKWIVESLVRDAKIRAVEGKDGVAVEVKEGMEDAKDFQVEKPLSRFTDADRKNDFKRLDRALTRTLYLVVKNKHGRWSFPGAELVGSENLHQVRYFSLVPLLTAVSPA